MVDGFVFFGATIKGQLKDDGFKNDGFCGCVYLREN